MAININAKTSGVGGLETSADNSGNINIQSGGSTVMSVTSSGVSVTGSFSQNGAVYSTQPTFRNLIINGDMRIDQRNAGTSMSTSSATSGNFQLDRWKTFIAGAAVVTAQQSSTAPTGFINSQSYTVATADSSIASGDLYVIEQPIEGLNCSNLSFGSASASTMTLSFWVRSSITGTYCGSLTNSAENRAYIFTYTISSANTWEQKTVTITGDTSGTWLTTNGIGIRVRFALAAGSTFQGTANTWSASNVFATSSQTQWVSTLGATFYITGVQLEVGSTATEFEHLPYDVELLRCKRYFERYEGVSTPPQTLCVVDVPNRAETNLNYYEKRTSPVITGSTDPLIGTMANSYLTATGGPYTYVGTSTISANLFYGVSSGISANALSGINFVYLPSGKYINIDAEL